MNSNHHKCENVGTTTGGGGLESIVTSKINPHLQANNPNISKECNFVIQKSQSFYSKYPSRQASATESVWIQRGISTENFTKDSEQIEFCAHWSSRVFDAKNETEDESPKSSLIRFNLGSLKDLNINDNAADDSCITPKAAQPSPTCSHDPPNSFCLLKSGTFASLPTVASSIRRGSMKKKSRVIFTRKFAIALFCLFLVTLILAFSVMTFIVSPTGPPSPLQELEQSISILEKANLDTENLVIRLQDYLKHLPGGNEE